MMGRPGRRHRPTVSDPDGASGTSPRGARPPVYIDALLSDFDDDAERWNHLGHWDDPSETPVLGSRTEAQRRLHDVVVEMAGVRDADRVLDLGSGFGGSLRALDERFRNVRLLGLDVDHRQLRRCRELRPRPGNSLEWLQGDGCALPIRDSSIDRVISIEAFWHLPSRERAMAEIARVLRDEGQAAIVDLLVLPDAAASLGLAQDQLEATLRSGFAPWPDMRTTAAQLVDQAGRVGLELLELHDATANTAPTYLDHGDAAERPGAASFSDNDAVRLFVDMHLRGCLQIVYVSFRRRRRARYSW